MRTRAQAKREKAEVEKQPFGYDPLEPDNIRLFKFLPESTREDIRCVMHHELQPNLLDREHGIDYLALSYCWRDPTPVATIILNGHAFPVARNLLHWLKTFTGGHSGTYFWVDAICIDQSNITERSVQVHQMWRIYSNAVCVISWLGLPDEKLTKVFEVLHTAEAMNGKARHSSSPYDSAEDEERDLIKDLISLPESSKAIQEFWKMEYWSRVWIVPEIVNANHIFVQSGHLVSAWQYLDVICDNGLQPTGAKLLFILRRLKGYNFRFPQRKGPVTPPRMIFFGNLVMLTTRHCTDPRDKLFAIASLPAYRDLIRTATFPIHYNMSNEEVCTAALSYYDQLTLCDSEIENAGMSAERRTADDNQVLTYVMLWCFNHDDLGDRIRYFEHWLRRHVTEDGSTIRLTSGEAIDCSGPLLSKITSCKADVCPKISAAHRLAMNSSCNLSKKTQAL